MGVAIWVIVYLLLGAVIAGLLYRFLFDADFIEWNKVFMIIFFYPILLPFYLLMAIVKAVSGF